MMADAESGEFWGLFGGFAPLPRKTATQDKSVESQTTQLYRYMFKKNANSGHYIFSHESDMSHPISLLNCSHVSSDHEEK